MKWYILAFLEDCLPEALRGGRMIADQMCSQTLEDCDGLQDLDLGLWARVTRYAAAYEIEEVFCCGRSVDMDHVEGLFCVLRAKALFWDDGLSALVLEGIEFLDEEQRETLEWLSNEYDVGLYEFNGHRLDIAEL